MRDIWYSYFAYLRHPFRLAKVFSTLGDRLDDSFMWEGRALRRLTLAESIACSWPFAILQAFYSLVALRLGVAFVSRLQEQYDRTLLSDYVSLENFHLQKYSLLMTIAGAILFPLGAWIIVKFWKVVTTMLITLFNTSLESDYPNERIERALAFTLSSHILLVVPILGAVLKKIAFLILFFAALREELGFSTIQSMMVIIFPLILIGSLIGFLGLLISISV